MKLLKDEKTRKPVIKSKSPKRGERKGLEHYLTGMGIIPIYFP